MELENKAVIGFSALCYNGIKLDTEKWTEVAQIVEKLVEQNIDILDSLVIEHPKLGKFKPKYIQTQMFKFKTRLTNINWSSNSQKLQIIQALGIKETSVGDLILQRYKKSHKLIKELIEYNKNAKLKSSFGMEFLNHVNPISKRVHCNIWQILNTGRISVSKPNLNQIPANGELAKAIRSCFIPEEGNVIVGGDYSGMELRLLAEFSQDPLWINTFNEGKDLHSILCAKTFSIPLEDVKNPFPHKPEMSYRDIQKRINFMLAYGGAEHKLADLTDLSIKQSATIIESFFAIVPFVKRTLDMFGYIARKHGSIRTAVPFRRQRLFPKWEEAVLTKDDKVLGEIERAAKNMPMQGSNGDIIKVAISEIQKKIDSEKLPIKLLLSVYDEIRTECPKDIAEWWKVTMQQIMIESAQLVIKSIPVVVDCTIKDKWEK